MLLRYAVSTVGGANRLRPGDSSVGSVSVLTDGIKALMRRCDRLPDNMSGTEIAHYSGEVIKRLKRGATIEGIEVYLRTFMTRPVPLPPHAALTGSSKSTCGRS